MFPYWEKYGPVYHLAMRILPGFRDGKPYLISLHNGVIGSVVRGCLARLTRIYSVVNANFSILYPVFLSFSVSRFHTIVSYTVPTPPPKKIKFGLNARFFYYKVCRNNEMLYTVLFIEVNWLWTKITVNLVTQINKIRIFNKNTHERKYVLIPGK